MSSYKETVVTEIVVPEGLPINPHLPVVFDDVSLAFRLGIRCKTLWFFIKRKSDLYSVFKIPKSSGKLRTIHNPDERLKYVHKKIASIFLGVLPLRPCVGAFVAGKGCVDTAKKHVGKAVLIKLDLYNFFHEHSRARVRNYFKSLGYNKFVASLLADLCTAPLKIKMKGGEYIKHVVPQGNPCSPALCNLIAQRDLDDAILNFLEGTGWVYTRYADDMAFSHKEHKTADELRDFKQAIYDIIVKAKYKVNHKKTRIIRRGSRQKLLGIVVNEHLNIQRSEYRKYRSIIHNCYANGFKNNAVRYGLELSEEVLSVDAFIYHLKGKVSYFKSVNINKGTSLETKLNLAIERSKNGTTC